MEYTSRRRVAVAMAVAMTVTSGASTALAQRARERANDRRDQVTQAVSGWTKLGERWVNGAADRDTVTAGASQGRYRRIMLKCEHSALEMFDVVITFGDNSTFSPTTRLVFNQTVTTRVIDLPGDARVIRQVQFRYGNLPGGGRAQVEVWAQ